MALRITIDQLAVAGSNAVVRVNLSQLMVLGQDPIWSVPVDEDYISSGGIKIGGVASISITLNLPSLFIIKEGVIASNAVTEINSANSSIGNRQLIDESVTSDILGVTTDSILVPFNNTSTSTGSSNVFIVQSPNTTISADYLRVSLDGIPQPQSEWVFLTSNDTVQFKDSSLGSGLIFNVTEWYIP